MEQKEHIATLCALGTIGAAAAGLAFGTDEVNPQIPRPGKRKWPGSNGTAWSSLASVPGLPRRTLSQPATPTLSSNSPDLSSLPAASRRFVSAPKLFAPTQDLVNQDSSSRASSKSRRSVLRPQTAASRTRAEKRDSGSSAGWMKRLSSFSSHSASPAPSISFQGSEDISQDDILNTRPTTSSAYSPNKLVKRSTSKRALSHDEARGQILRRPATSHQRSQVFKHFLSRPASQHDDPVQVEIQTDPRLTLMPVVAETRLWRPYFEPHFPRKRRRSEAAADTSQIRIISKPIHVTPVMLLGTDMDQSEISQDDSDRFNSLPIMSDQPAVQRRRSRRSLASLRNVTIHRRNFTDPSTHLTRTPANGMIASISNSNYTSPPLQTSAFDIPLPSSTPLFTSSPPLIQYATAITTRPRHSTSVSDQPTISSDYEARIFSDDESVDFRSDTAYDSIATRATNASHVGNSESKLDTIFAVRTSSETEPRPEIWQSLSRENLAQVNLQNSPFYKHEVHMHGIGISVPGTNSTSVASFQHDVDMTTPPRSPSLQSEDFMNTPVPLKHHATRVDSSPPLLPLTNGVKHYEGVGEMLQDLQLDDNESTWSVANNEADDSQPRTQPAIKITTNVTHPLLTKFQETDENQSPQLTHKPSIFDWSEHQYNASFPRPKTVHGKQGDRSRSSGRKGPPQLHFRSQSVPINRDSPGEELSSASKYKTWRFGQKPVSEEWSDDFEFEDTDAPVDSPAVDAQPQAFHGSVRSVRIPQAIIDRQPSVHLQFGQVQEFMALVEELKRLQVRGAELKLLDGPARGLWKDAESIINLATINDEEDGIIASSPSSTDPFLDVVVLPPTVVHATATVRPRRPTTSGRRSVSTMTPPPIHGRARGESLAQARHFLQAMHENRDGIGSSPREIEIHKQKKLPFDTQDLKDLVVRSGAITRQLKDEVRKAEGVTISPEKTPPRSRRRDNDDDHPLKDLFNVPAPSEASSPCPPFRKPGLPKSKSANSYLEIGGSRRESTPFSSPMALTAAV